MRKYIDFALSTAVLVYMVYAQINDDRDLKKLRVRMRPHSHRLHNRVRRIRTWWKLGEPAYSELVEFSVEDGYIPASEN